jgi:hypothetical protein
MQLQTTGSVKAPGIGDPEYSSETGAVLGTDGQ